MEIGSSSSQGFFGSLKKLLDTGLALAQNRIELFALELQEEKLRLVEALLWAAAVVVLSVITLSLITLTIIVVFWDDARLAALLILTSAYLVATALAGLGLRQRILKRAAFAGSMSQLQKDRECLTAQP